MITKCQQSVLERYHLQTQHEITSLSPYVYLIALEMSTGTPKSDISLQDGFLDTPKSTRQRHLDRLTRFCRACQQCNTHTQTDTTEHR